MEFWNQDEQMCPLHLAVRDGDMESLDLLFAAGAKVDSVAYSKKRNVRTSLLQVAQMNENQEMIQYLVDKGVNK